MAAETREREIETAFNRFDAAAKDWGWEADQGVGRVEESRVEYESAKAALRALFAPSERDRAALVLHQTDARDTERLDWLQSRVIGTQVKWTQAKGRTWLTLRYISQMGRKRVFYGNAATVREVLDTAIAAPDDAFALSSRAE